MSQCGPNCNCPEGHKAREKSVADQQSLDLCVAQIRQKLAEKPNSNNPKGLVTCKVTWHGAINAVAEVLTSEELARVRFRVAA